MLHSHNQHNTTHVSLFQMHEIHACMCVWTNIMHGIFGDRCCCRARVSTPKLAGQYHTAAPYNLFIISSFSTDWTTTRAKSYPTAHSNFNQLVGRERVCVRVWAGVEQLNLHNRPHIAINYSRPLDACKHPRNIWPRRARAQRNPRSECTIFCIVGLKSVNR